ncbi:MAG: hypothetical protein HKN23_14140 [Verrucomicrobiales bacterium]|nr:hypothetical protein [Verrucomicrobiales bacterium]
MVLSSGDEFKDISFQNVIESSTGRTILPFDAGDPADAEVLAAISSALDAALSKFSEEGSPTNSEKRINEVSSYFEEEIRHHLEREPGISCDYPKTAEGRTQRSGYPDLRIVHEESGRVTYFDPKLVETGSLDSSLRSFYFSPKTETNKVLEDAHHLLVGIEHDGNTGNWKFLRWHLVDLSEFKVRLKAEFQASNRDLYQPNLMIGEGGNEPGEENR